MLPEDGSEREYVEKDDVLPAYSRTPTWHTPARDSVFGSPVEPTFSPAYHPDDYTVWSAMACTAGQGEKFDPCHRSTVHIAQCCRSSLRSWMRVKAYGIIDRLIEELTND